MKCIVSDIDGTLLRRNEKKPDKTVLDLIDNTKASGASFCVATGRSLSEVKKLFPNSEKIVIICCDGALGVIDDETVFVRCFDSDEIAKFNNFSEVALYGKYMTYIKGQSGFVRDRKKQFFHHAVAFENTSEINEPVYKAVVYKKRGEKINIDGIDKIYDSYNMTEFVPAGTDKCTALCDVLKRLDIPPGDCLVFGDGDNDISMLKAFSNSYAMVWAKPAVKAAASAISDSVIKTVNTKLKKGM